MCKFISFWYKPSNMDLAVWDLSHHHNTSKKLKLNDKIWREGHYTPDGEIECRVLDSDKYTQEECNDRLHRRYPTFQKFLKYCMDNIPDNYEGSLYLQECDLKDITLPTKLRGNLYLFGCDLKGIKIPENLKNKVIT